MQVLSGKIVHKNIDQLSESDFDIDLTSSLACLQL